MAARGAIEIDARVGAATFAGLAPLATHKDMKLGSASERAKGRGAVWAKSGHSAQYYYRMLLARLGMGEGERANTSAGSRA